MRRLFRWQRTSLSSRTNLETYKTLRIERTTACRINRYDYGSNPRSAQDTSFWGLKDLALVPNHCKVVRLASEVVFQAADEH